ncbi:MAG: SAM-dependent methyltransferase [Pseudomonadota bacterium]
MIETEQHRHFFAKLMLAAGGGKFSPLESAVAAVPRERFLGKGPWQVFVNGEYLTTPTDDPAFVYNNYLIALDAENGINNGEPFLHANWISAVTPNIAEIVCHVGAGTGYYSALMAHMVGPDGEVQAFEVDPNLAQKAETNLSRYRNVGVHAANAVDNSIPDADVIYVNAGLPTPPAHWLRALRPNGRMIFPWRPTQNVGLALIVTRTDQGLAATPLMRSLFIPCVGVTSPMLKPANLNPFDAWKTRAVHLTENSQPDESAIAVFDDVWFSRDPLT